MESDYILFRCEFESFRVCQYFMVLSRKHGLICKLDMMTIRCDGRTLSRHNDVAVIPGLYGLFRTFRTVSPRNGGDRSLCAAMDLQERNILSLITPSHIFLVRSCKQILKEMIPVLAQDGKPKKTIHNGFPEEGKNPTQTGGFIIGFTTLYRAALYY